MPERIAWVDFAKGLAMILVVFGHVILPSLLQNFIYVFHMPFFFIMAGFLLNFEKWGGEKNYKAFATKLFKRLLVPYYLANFLCYPFFVVKENYFGHMSWVITYNSPVDTFLGIFIGRSIMLPLGVLWFLPCLLVTEIIFIRLWNRFVKISAELFALVIVLTVCAGFTLSRFGYLPLGVNVALISQIFLLAGILIRRNNFVERMDLKIFGGISLLLMFAFQFNQRVEMSWAIFGDAFLFFAGGLSGTLILMKISALMTDGKIFSLISDCGRQSMMILVLHSIIFNVAYEIIVDALKFPAEKIFTDAAVIFFVTAAGVLIPLFVAKKFGRLPVLKNFCA